MDNYKIKFFNRLSQIEKNNLLESYFYNFFLNNWEYNFLSIKYNMEYLKKDFQNNTLIIYRNTCPIFLIPSIDSGNKISWFDTSTRVIHYNLDNEELEICYNLIRKSFLKKTDFFPVEALIVSNPYLVNKFYNNIVDDKVVYIGNIDLTINEKDIFKNIRKSYKSLINWGTKSFDLKTIDKNNYNMQEFKSFKHLHFEASGRQTRSDKTWDIQLQMIENNTAYLVLAFEKTKLVAGVFIQHDHSNAFYGVAVSDRSIMEEGKSLTHSTLWYAINVAKLKGIKNFSFGDISKSSDDKLNNINLFKKGFCTNVDTTLELKLAF